LVEIVFDATITGLVGGDDGAINSVIRTNGQRIQLNKLENIISKSTTDKDFEDAIRHCVLIDFQFNSQKGRYEKAVTVAPSVTLFRRQMRQCIRIPPPYETPHTK
jgi:hypothetical protein